MNKILDKIDKQILADRARIRNIHKAVKMNEAEYAELQELSEKTGLKECGVIRLSLKELYNSINKIK